jgi:hydroxymethylpyrimidine/phosphomethylpyrimidine kinase
VRVKAPVALTIAGSDSGGGAGIQADLKTFSALGVYGASAITAVTAQDTQRVYGIVELEPAFIAQQIDAVAGDLGVDVVKTGMLSSAAIIEAVAERLQRWKIATVVVDPVMVAKGGDRLLREDAVTALRTHLLPLATVVTPNLPEAEVLVGHSLSSWDDMRDAAREIAGFGAQNVVIKGGHAEGDVVTDLLFDGKDFREYSAARVPTTSTHGTGCTFASALAATLAKGETVPQSVAAAKAYVTKALQEAYPLGHGHGPVHHFYRYWRPLGVRRPR